MPDCFIAFSHADQRLAAFMREELKQHGITSFLASASLQPGETWSPAIRGNLADSGWVVVLASRASVASALQHREVRRALLDSRPLVPIVWDITPSELPGWLRDFQTIDLSRVTLPVLRRDIAAIAGRIEGERTVGSVILGAAALGFIILGAADG